MNITENTFLARLAARSTALVAVSVLTAVTACAQTDVDDGGHKARGPAATLQADAKALLPQGAPGVPVAVRTAHRTVKVRAGYGNKADKTPVP